MGRNLALKGTLSMALIVGYLLESWPLKLRTWLWFWPECLSQKLKRSLHGLPLIKQSVVQSWNNYHGCVVHTTDTCSRQWHSNNCTAALWNHQQTAWSNAHSIICRSASNNKAKELLGAILDDRCTVVQPGHLYITFNFLRAVDQHVENGGLNDVWIEAGGYAANGTKAMMVG